MKNLKISAVEQTQIKPSVKEIHTGDTIKASIIIFEGNKERIQAFEGLVIKTQGSGIAKSVTIRKYSSGIGVERTFQIHSPAVHDIEIISRAKVRRSRIYYMRNLKGKKAKLKKLYTKN